jgi:hypothetical protein
MTFVKFLLDFLESVTLFDHEKAIILVDQNVWGIYYLIRVKRKRYSQNRNNKKENETFIKLHNIAKGVKNNKNGISFRRSPLTWLRMVDNTTLANWFMLQAREKMQSVPN